MFKYAMTPARGPLYSGESKSKNKDKCHAPLIWVGRGRWLGLVDDGEQECSRVASDRILEHLMKPIGVIGVEGSVSQILV